MSDNLIKILSFNTFSKEDIVTLLSVKSEAEREHVFNKAESIREESVGKNIYLRGLIELSNICEKNCLYCGIRAGNKQVERYIVSEKDVIASINHALEKNYGSVVIQSGERTDEEFVEMIDGVIKKIKTISDGKLGITLSCGEQTPETYRKWYKSGAHRYLLRIETSDPELYYKIHPQNKKHFLVNRLVALRHLREIGYQVGSGVMIGLPGQTVSQLADDLLFLKQMDVDMVGMGPYIEHKHTPLYQFSNNLIPKAERLNLSLVMIAVLRIMMKNINIASSTALDSLDSNGRLLAIKAGANVLMPNLTPVKYRENYFLYDNKPYLTEADELVENIGSSEILKGYLIKLGEWGDSAHFFPDRNKIGLCKIQL
ncbi:MAG: [FeFe] hydrogenase H-cluster radical SAM maturase HydE [Bacteroidales bacterium]